MKYRELGKTGLKVSVIGFGGIPIQRVSADEAVSVIKRAEELGINFIDSARGYSTSEEYIGKAIKGRRDKWIIATKSLARDKKSFIKDIDTSLRNFQTDYIDLYQIHNVKDMDTYNSVISDGGVYEALLEARKSGKVGHIGISAHSLDTLKKAIESGLFETIMYPYNIIENQAEELFKRAAELNTGVIVMKPMAGGAIKSGDLAMRFILQNLNISTIIPGMADIHEVEENANSVYRGELTETEIQECNKLREDMGQVFCRRCGYCLPCPQGIDIPFSFILKLYFDNYDLKDWALSRYNSMNSRPDSCKECGLCEGRCPYNLPIRKMLKEVAKTFNSHE